MDISVESNILNILPQLDQLTSKQAPFSIAFALTKTANRVMFGLMDQIPVAFDRPNAWTKNAFAVKPARKRDLQAWVYAKDSQAKYLKFGVQGGQRRIKGFEKRFDAMLKDHNAAGGALVPTKNIKLDASGNVSMAAIKRMSQTGSGGKYFVGKPKGGGKNANLPVGVYQRMGRNKRIRLMLEFVPTPRYRKRLDMAGIANRVVQQTFSKNLEDAFTFAMQSSTRSPTTISGDGTTIKIF